MLLWAKGLAATSDMQVEVREPDVSTAASRAMFARYFAPPLEMHQELKYYRFMEYDWNGVPLIISRTGWSSELGYEIFLRDGSYGEVLWEYLMQVGHPMGLHPGHTSSIRRIEAAMLSYHADMTLANNPFELGMDRLVDLDMTADFVSKKALQKIAKEGVTQYQVGLKFDGAPITGTNDEFWAIMVNDVQIGYVTSAVYSPRLQENIALGLVDASYAEIGTEIVLVTRFGVRGGVITPKPFMIEKDARSENLKKQAKDYVQWNKAFFPGPTHRRFHWRWAGLAALFLAVQCRGDSCSLQGSFNLSP